MVRLTINMLYENKFVGGQNFHHIKVKLDGNEIYAKMVTIDEATTILGKITKRVEELNNGKNFEQDYIWNQCDTASQN